MVEQPSPNIPTPSPVRGNERTMAIASLVIGIINLCAWIFPICGVPLGLVGLVLGYFGMKDISQKGLSIAGMALSGIGLALACVSIAVPSVLNLLGPQIGNVFSSINSSLQP